MEANDYIDQIIAFYELSWTPAAFIYGATWSLKIAKKVFSTL